MLTKRINLRIKVSNSATYIKLAYRKLKIAECEHAFGAFFFLLLRLIKRITFASVDVNVNIYVELNGNVFVANFSASHAALITTKLSTKTH